VHKVFPYDPPVSQGTSVTDGRTDRLTNDNHANSSTVTEVHRRVSQIISGRSCKRFKPSTPGSTTWSPHEAASFICYGQHRRLTHIGSQVLFSATDSTQLRPP